MPSRKERQRQRHRTTQTMRKVRKSIKRRKPKRVRYRDRIPEHINDFDDLYDLDFPQSERMTPREERERHQAMPVLDAVPTQLEETQ